MLNSNPIARALVLSLWVLCPVVALAGNFDSGYRYDPGDTSRAPWGGQSHARDQIRRDQEQAREQQADMERQRSQERIRQWKNDAAAGSFTPKADPDHIGAINSSHSSSGTFSSCYGSGNWRMCQNAGGPK